MSIITGWPPGLLQDDSRPLSRWLAGRADAWRLARLAASENATQQATKNPLKINGLPSETALEQAALNQSGGLAEGVNK